MGLDDLEWFDLGLRNLELGDELGGVLGLEFVFLLHNVTGPRQIGESEAWLLLRDN